MGRPSTAKERLIRTASAEFARAGAQAVGVDELCRRARANKGSFYHFFPSKNDLILACLENAWKSLRSDVLEPAFAPDRTPHERIVAYFDRLILRQEKQQTQVGVFSGCVFGTLGNELCLLTPEIRTLVATYADRMIAFVEGTLREAAENGQFAGDPEATARAIHIIMVGAHIEVRLRQDLTPIRHARETAENLMRIHAPAAGVPL